MGSNGKRLTNLSDVIVTERMAKVETNRRQGKTEANRLVA
jgi:hypothetical protein